MSFDSTGVAATWSSNSANPLYLCPDLLRYEQIGAADNLRGRVVRLFFFLMQWWPA